MQRRIGDTLPYVTENDSCLPLSRNLPKRRLCLVRAQPSLQEFELGRNGLRTTILVWRIQRTFLRMSQCEVVALLGCDQFPEQDADPFDVTLFESLAQNFG